MSEYDVDLALFSGEYVPNAEGVPYHGKWLAANKNGDAPKWESYRDALLRGEEPAPPVMATRYGRALVAAGKQHMSITRLVGAVQNPYPPPDPPPPPPPGNVNALRYAPPTLGEGGVAIVNFTLNDSTRSSSTLSSGAGRDLRITQNGVLTGPINSLYGWRHIVWIGGEFNAPSSVTNETQLAVIQACTGTVHIEGIKGRTAGAVDFFPLRWGGSSHILQFQNCDLQVTHAGTGIHADVFQTQELRCASLRFDRCTIYTDYQGIFVSNEPDSNPDPNFFSQVSETRISRTNFRLQGGVAGLWIFKAIPSRTGLLPGPWYIDDVWIPNVTPGSKVYPTTAFIDWQNNSYKYGCFLRSDGQGPYLEWSTPADTVPSGAFAGQPCADTQITGKMRIGSPPDFVTGNPGMSYVSPGYQ